MVKSLSEIVLDLIEFYKAAIPEADTKIGTVVRDLFIDLPASQIALLYDEVSAISNLQSLRLVGGSDLEKLGQNLGASKKVAAPSSGTALLTFSSIPATIGINSGDIVTAQNGLTFRVVNGISVDAAKSNYYRALATKYQNDLSYLGITDQFAAEVLVKATVPGANGNISKYSLNKISTAGVSNITNLFSFTGGTDQETDELYRNRVLAIFSGSNIGTALGYRNTALTNSYVTDALVISPGDILMTRDGTVVSTAVDGTRTITSEGTGGKIDVIILGTNIVQSTDTFIYRDKSNNNDPTDPSNDFIIGQISGDENKTITRKRIDNIALGILPSQPIEEVTEVSGSLSGTNFIPKTIDSLGRVTGNYELVKDTGVYNGSPWARDVFKWSSNEISLFQEDLIRAQFNGQDATGFTDVTSIPIVRQNISINSENSTVSNSDRSIVQLLHTPCSGITRVLNSNTGERYTVTNQNLDSGTPYNNTGRIKISGNTLPSSSDILQVDYTWIIDYDQYSDYDGKILGNNPRSSVDSIDWGIPNVIRSERVNFSLNAGSTLYTGDSLLPISSIISANTFKIIVGVVEASTVVNFSNRLAISISAIDSQIDTISSIKLSGTEKELYSTASSDGLFLNNRVVVGINIKYNVSVILPTDTKAVIGQYVEIVYNIADVFNVTDSIGSFVNKSITIPSGNITSLVSMTLLEVTYLSSSQTLLTNSITNLPISRDGNGFLLSTNTGSKNTILSDCINRQNQTIQKDVSNNFYVKLSLSSSEYTLTSENIITVINILTGKEYWNSGDPGTLSIDVDLNYVLTFSGLNLPAIGEQVLVVFKSIDILRGQPFTFNNDIIKYNLNIVDYDYTNNNYYCPINNFSIESSIPFTLKDPITNVSSLSAIDGYITNIDSNILTFASSGSNFSLISELKSKKIIIDSSIYSNNNGSYSILAMVDNNTLTLSTPTNNISNNQVDVIRLSDNKNLWNPSTATIVSNTLNLDSTVSATPGDKVLVLTFKNKALRQSPTRLSVSLADQLTNNGIITISGTTLTKVSDVIFTATQNGLKQNLLEAMKIFLGVSTTSSISSDKSIVRMLKIEKVSTTTNNEVLSTIATYDILGTEVYNNLLYSGSMDEDLLLTSLDFRLPSTANNIAYVPVVGDKLRVSFVYSTSNDSENIYFTRNGSIYTNKKFAILNKMFVSSGFNSSQSSRFTTSFFTQPITGTRYKVYYNYLAPKQNERILIKTNFNRAITDVTFSIEASRPINADVIVRAAKEILVNANMSIIIKTDFLSSAPIVLQNVKDKLTTTINTGILGDILNGSNLEAAAQGVDGVDRVRVTYFNMSGELGTVLSLTAYDDEYFVANDILIIQETR